MVQSSHSPFSVFFIEIISAKVKCLFLHNGLEANNYFRAIPVQSEAVIGCLCNSELTPTDTFQELRTIAHKMYFARAC